MGQFGALGYATTYNWNYTQILAHYYGGTTIASHADSAINVQLSELYGTASIKVSAPSGSVLELNGKAIADGTTVERATADQTLTVSSGDVIVYGPWPYGGDQRQFQGAIVLKGTSTAFPSETWNVLPLDEYVEGVVPRESPASWPSAALEAQAVAARSYALAYLADDQYADICDTTSCQVYGGDPTQYGANSVSYYENSNAAVTDTAGQILDCGTDAACGGPTQIAFTEFSSSTGGYTAGGIFPAVVDLGDATASNPNHDWTASVTTSAVQSAFPSVGTLQSVTVTGRNGLGDLGGRVTQMVLTGTAGPLTITGDQFEYALGLKSDWFAIANGGANGTVWDVGTDPVGGGYGIFRWTGSTWVQVPGGAVTIAVDSDGDPWVVNSSRQIYHWNGSGWTGYPGAATDMSAGANGAV